MPKAPLPANETERLQALKRYDILDSDAEGIFDEITAVAADFFDAPVSLISLLDEDRQWFKSHHGTAIAQTPRDMAICGHAILDEDVLVVGDATKDARTADNPLVTADPSIRFYAGAPLVTNDGFRLGTLCVIDDKARSTATPHQVEVLKRLARLVTYELDLRLAHRQRLEQLAIISHELRSPLNAILGFSDVMREEVFGPLGNPRYRAYVEDIHRSGLHLLSLVNDLLDVGKLQAGKFELHEETLDLAEVVAEVADRARHDAEKRGVSIHAEVPASVRVNADRRAMLQILTNLVSNAVKFSNPGGHVTIRMILAGDIVLEVIDQGIGVAPDELPKIFDSFTQGSHSRGGTGLGLSIVKHLAELHGGVASANSAQGVGTVVTIRLPKARMVLE
ncbi:MAG: GAF domain-containing sensor histidine kinase [Elsteraceae bacterium]